MSFIFPRSQPSENQNQLPYFQRGTKREKLSILLVGDEEFGNIMQQHIHDVNKEISKLPLIVSIAESVKDILESTEILHVDLIIFLMHTGRRQSIEQVERDICSLEPVYLCDRTLLINGCNQLSPIERAVSSDELFNLAQKYHLHVFHGNILDEKSGSRLAQRVLSLVPSVCGLKTGIPIALHFPVDKFKLF